MEYMAYLGYPIHENNNQLSAITVTREKKLDLAKKVSSRNVYRCHVIGAKGVGKSTICAGLVGRNIMTEVRILELKRNCVMYRVRLKFIQVNEKAKILNIIIIKRKNI